MFQFWVASVLADSPGTEFVWVLGCARLWGKDVAIWDGIAYGDMDSKG